MVLARAAGVVNLSFLNTIKPFNHVLISIGSENPFVCLVHQSIVQFEVNMNL